MYVCYLYTLQVRMSTSGIVIHCITKGFQSFNPQEIHCCKWEFCVRFAWHFSGTYCWCKM